ncbi:alpha/beta hydrolase [Streptomyces sp. NPDC058417]|uniref:alpha/beta hydrolase n=1 Tax=unclassified Streptomyces TaxID=2593676 RepID=UPI00364A6962
MPTTPPPPPPFDPELAAALAATGQTSFATGITLDTLAAEREVLRMFTPTLADLTADERFEVEEHTAPGPDGAPDVPLLVVRPRGLTGTRPVIYHTHGGGLIMGDNRYGLHTALEWALELDAVVVSVEYRLAPEHPFPAGFDDAWAGLLWTARNADRISGDPRRVLLAGGSAGGNLAAALALRDRDTKEVGVLGQVLLYPMLDDRNDTASALQMTGLGVWDRDSNRTGWEAWLSGTEQGEEPSAYASPGRAEDLSGLAPAFLDVGTAETFRDEVVTYASRIWQAGGQAELHVWPGAFHGFDQLAPQSALAQAARDARLRWLRRLLGE